VVRHWALAFAPGAQGGSATNTIIDPRNSSATPTSDRVPAARALILGHTTVPMGSHDEAFGLELMVPLVDAALFRALGLPARAQAACTGQGCCEEGTGTQRA